MSNSINNIINKDCIGFEDGFVESSDLMDLELTKSIAEADLG